MSMYMVSWTIASGHHKEAALAFLESGATMPEGLTAIGRYHMPSSQKGWLICEGSSEALSEHLVQWGRLLDFEVYPVVSDEVSGAAIAKVYG